MTSLLGPGAPIPTAVRDRNGNVVYGAQSGAAGTRGPELRVNPARGATFDLNFIATGTVAGDHINIFGSGSANLDDFQRIGVITLVADPISGLPVGNLDIDAAWERVYAAAESGNAGTVSCQVVTSV